MPFLHLALGAHHVTRFELLNDPEDLDKAIESGSIALSMSSPSDPGFVLVLDLLGGSHMNRFRRIGKAEDSKKAIEYQSRAIACTPDGHPDLPIRLTHIGASYNDRYQRQGDVDDLRRAIEYLSRAVALTPDGHPDLPIFLAGLGLSHTCMYELLGELNDLQKAIEYNTRAIALTPHGHPHLPICLESLGQSHRSQYHRLGELNDLHSAIECNDRAVELTPDSDSSLSMRLTNLGNSYNDRYQRLGELNDLDKALRSIARAVELTPEGHPDLPLHLANLGKSLKYRYQRLGEIGDIDKAIACMTRAITLTPDIHPSFPGQLTDLGVTLSGRYQRLGELNDLEKAIELESRAVASTPDGHPDLPSRLTNLGLSHNQRYHRLGELSDLDKAIECNARAVALTPDGRPNLPWGLGILGASHGDRYKHLGGLSDLEKAIECGTRGVSLTPDDHPELPLQLKNLSVSHEHRYKHLGNLSDLQKAIEYNTRALDLLPPGHPNLLVLHFSHALSYLAYYQHSGNPAHAKVSLDSFRSASQAPIGSPRAKFDHAFSWAKRSTIHDFLNPIEAYETTIGLLPQLVWLGATTYQRYQDLATIKGLAINAASVAVRSSKPSLALEWLEQARCVVWNQSLMLRSPLDRLQTEYPALAARLQNIAHQLHNSGSQPRESQALSPHSLTVEQVAQEHRELAAEYDGLIAQARSLPGFTELLRPLKTIELIDAARYGPVVMINCHQDRCDALLILPGEDDIYHVPLPGFTGKDAETARLSLQKSIRSKGLRERGVKHKQKSGQSDPFGSVLAGLWHKVVNPVLDFLGYTKNDQMNKLPHITWCPTGALSFLPLHAAGDYDQPKSRVFDYAISSYTPTINALLASIPNTLTEDTQVLAIGQEATPGHNPLRGTARELEYIQTHAHSTVRYTELMDDQATASAVLDAMEQHDWVHLACHAHQNVNDPTKSGFFLHDGTLDLAAINRRSFKNKGLAYLSACQTAKGDEELPDEAIHLASGMLMAGYSSVIATMWSVFDADAPLVADKVYEQLMRDRKLGNGEAGKALHNAVAELRGKVGEKAFERWVPYIHIGS